MDRTECISVIVPVYKVEAYLDRCVESIVNQTTRNLEIILVDDGSPDHCGAMCDAWAFRDDRIKVIHKENGGLSDARNAGLQMASGAYISFVDSDDWIHPEFLERLYNAAVLHGADLAACDIRIVNPGDEGNDEVVQGESIPYAAEQAIETLTNGVGFRAVAWNKLYSASLLLGESFPVGKYHEDEFFTYRILDKARRLAYVDAQLYFYLQRPGSIMQTVSVKHLDLLDAYLERMELFREKYPRLYRKDKVMFCVTYVSFYRDALHSRSSETQYIRDMIASRRKKINFSVRELCSLPIRKLVYVLGSGRMLHLVSMVLNCMRG